MTRNTSIRWFLLVTVNVAMWCMLSLQQTVGADSESTTMIAIRQRTEIIAQLKEIKTDVKALLAYRVNEALPITPPVRP